MTPRQKNGAMLVVVLLAGWFALVALGIPPGAAALQIAQLVVAYLAMVLLLVALACALFAATVLAAVGLILIVVAGAWCGDRLGRIR